jgi:hypothetical protein
MPNLDGTGPQGQGAMTGRRRGRCVSNKTNISESQDKEIVQEQNNESTPGQGFGGGFGRGRRRRGGGGGFQNRFRGGS